MGDGKCQTQASVLINGTAAVFATHPANWRKPCKSSDRFLFLQSLIQVLFFISLKKPFQK